VTETRGWSVARLDEVGNATDQAYWDGWSREPGYGQKWRSVRKHFGITSFGVNAYEASAGEELVVPHDEVGEGGQEELYFLARGRARFVCDGEEVDLGEGELLYAPPEVRREARALESPTIVFMVGGLPGKPYED